ncbi:MAG: hypothetical protein Q9157_005457 [Trypethelium eluteriae]
MENAPGSNLSSSHNQYSDNASSESLSPLEQEVLDEYARLVGNLNNLSASLSTIAAHPSSEILDSLRGLERKTSLVFTLLKASVYSIVLQQQIEATNMAKLHLRISLFDLPNLCIFLTTATVSLLRKFTALKIRAYFVGEDVIDYLQQVGCAVNASTAAPSSAVAAPMLTTAAQSSFSSAAHASMQVNHATSLQTQLGYAGNVIDPTMMACGFQLPVPCLRSWDRCNLPEEGEDFLTDYAARGAIIELINEILKNIKDRLGQGF